MALYSGTHTVIVEDTQSVPCGFIQATVESYPKITRINTKMLNLLGLSETCKDWRDFLMDNLYLIMPPADRDRLQDCIEQALESNEPVFAYHQICQRDNTRIPVASCISSAVAEDGTPAINIMFTKASHIRYFSSIGVENTYFNALKNAYGVIFEVNLQTQTVECIHGKETSDIGPLFDVRMTIDSAKAFWLNNFIVPKDRPMMQEFFDLVSTPGALEQANRPLTITVEVTWSDGITYKMIGVAVQRDPSTVLLCFRDITDIRYEASRFNNVSHVPDTGVFIRTFGHFDVFCNGKPVIFSSAKEKELMALLVDRHGGSVTTNEAIPLLWEVDNPDDRIKARYRRLLLSLKNTLIRYGIEDTLIYMRGARSINVPAVTCDYYEYLADNKEYREAFHNSYLSGYSWAESTLATLWEHR